MLDKCSNSRVEVLLTVVSDHRILLCQLDMSVSKRKTPFHHINSWCKLKNYREVVESVWSIQVNGFPMVRFITKLKATKVALAKWNKINVGDIHEKARACAQEDENAQRLFNAHPHDINIQLRLKDSREVAKSAFEVEESFLR